MKKWIEVENAIGRLFEKAENHVNHNNLLLHFLLQLYKIARWSEVRLNSSSRLCFVVQHTCFVEGKQMLLEGHYERIDK